MPFREGLAPPEDAIRSIRVASTLIDRFRAIVSTNVTSPGELELRIGESQQIYPEIWRHLEDARRVLAANGRDVARIDELRNRELVSLGVTNVEITRELDVSALILGGRIRYSASKTASFNTGGAARAQAVARALMDALPDVDWAALARAEDREIAAAGSMKTHKWLSIVKVAAAAGAVLAVVLIVQRVTSGVHEAAPAPEVPQIDLVASTRLTLARLREARIDELRAHYTLTCDATHKSELLQLLREEGETTTATKLETTPCERTLPKCDTLHVPIMDRFITNKTLVRDRALDLSCRGIVLGQDFHTAFVVVVSGHGPDHKPYTFRGVVPIEGEKNIVPFEQAPVPFFVGTGDLDGDARDELVMAGGQKLVVSHVEGNKFVDIEGPALPMSCRANATVERDFREEGKPTHESLVIEVEEPAQRGCPEPGRHYYSLVNGAVVED